MLSSLDFGSSAIAEPAVFEKEAFVSYKPNLKNGEYMFNAAGCAACHGSSADPNLLSGGLKMRSAIGTFKVPNITSSARGIGGWSNADFLNAVVIGIKPDGSYLYPVMPFTAYAGMKPQDVLDIKGYIGTLPKSDAKSGDNEISFPYNQQYMVAFWRLVNFTTKSYQPVPDSQRERGRYLVENVAACGQCHSGRTLSFGIDTSKAYAGEKGLTGEFAPAIGSSRLASLAAPTAFVDGVLAKGLKLDGSPIAAGSMKRITEGTAKLTEKDRTAMFAYLAKKEVKLKPQISVTACAASAAPVVSGASELTSAAEDFVGRYCRSCHGPGESAQGSFSADDASSIAANPAYVTPGKPEKSLLYTVVANGRMPLGKKPASDEVAQLAAWIKSLKVGQTAAVAVATTPARQRPIISYDSEITNAVKDLNSVDELDRQYTRYFSYRAQYNTVLGCETNAQFGSRLKYYQAGFRKLLNSLSYSPRLVIPKPVTGTQGTLVRIDLRDLNWSAADWDRMIGHYFYGVSPSGDAELETLIRTTGTQLPVVRTDWFMANASKPPLYDEFLKFGHNIKDVENDILHVDRAKEIRDLDVVRAGFGKGHSGVSDHNRMVERYDLSRDGYYWVSYDFSGDTGRQDLKRFPHGPDGIGTLPTHLQPFEHAGGEMIFSLPNGMQGYYLANNKGQKLDTAPTEIVHFRNRPSGKGFAIINGRSCFDCHANGIISKRDELRHNIKTSSSFSREQQNVLLKMYVPEDRLNALYERDMRRFVSALDQIGAAEKTANGSLQALAIPGKTGGTEAITYYADLYEDDLDFEALAGEFDMTPDQFKDAAQRLRGDALKTAFEWISRLKGGDRIPRSDVESNYAELLQPLTEHVALGAGSGQNVVSTGGDLVAGNRAPSPAPSKPVNLDYSSVRKSPADSLKLAIKARTKANDDTNISLKGTLNAAKHKDAAVAALAAPPANLKRKADSLNEIQCESLSVTVAEQKKCLKVGEQFQDCPQCPKMVVIPSGQIELGKDDRWIFPQLWPRHKVTFNHPFAVGKFEITVAEFDAFMRETGYKVANNCEKITYKETPEQEQRAPTSSGFSSGFLELLPAITKKVSFRDPGFQQTGLNPAVCVSWDDAGAYVKWLSRKTGHEYRLLSEAEWRFARDVGVPPENASLTTSLDEDIAICRFANIAGWYSYSPSKKDTCEATGGTKPAGSYRPNRFGLFDMLGNVREWGQDCSHKSYEGAPSDRSPWISKDCTERVLLDEGWDSRLSDLSIRFFARHDLQDPDVGFRVARGIRSSRKEYVAQ
jgi:formylglycine-generating enzyme required for sulfatase activity/mono/diheme cytochrome c family protein